MSGFLLHLLRHGAPETPGLLMGRTDGAPTAAGIAACVARAERLAFETLIASDLARAAAVGEALAGRREAALTIDPRWRELDFGAWDGRRPDEIDPAALRDFHEDPDACPPPGGEGWSALVDRVSAALRDLPPRPTLVVTHGGAMRAALAVACGLGKRCVWAFDLPHASLLTLRLWPGRPPTAQIVGLRA